MTRQAGWIAAEAVIGMAGTVVTTFLVARIVGPDQVGRAALASAVVMLVQPIAAYAFTNAMVQRPALATPDIASVLWTSLGLAVALALTIAAAGLLLPGLLGPGVGPLLAALALVLPLNAIEGTANGVLLRRHTFRELALRGIGAHTVGLATGLSLALAGAGAWAIVGQQLAFFGTAAALAAAFARLPAVPVLHLGTIRGMARFAVTSAAGGIAERAGLRLFLLVVAGGLPALAGVLQIAFRIVEVARDLPSPFVHRYGLPALSRLRPRPEAFQRRLQALCSLAGLAFAPVFAGLALCAPDVQAVLLGPAWTGIVAPVQVLSAALALGAFALPFGMAFTAAGRPEVNLVLTVGGIGLTLLLALLVPKAGPPAAAAWAAALLADAAAASVFASRWLGFPLRRQARLLAAALLPAAAVVAAVLAAEAAGLLPARPALLVLAAKVAIGAAAGGPILVLLARAPWREVSAPVPDAS
ncbi:oligosaccharide flippase family protein [Falsiroseomonas sp. HW251]|uniref:oligosaccharide flippase family protein n=1 Tax=Falsiroseomonas sp. HW251 TaxID=3390998 RepID=UPI003D31451A